MSPASATRQMLHPIVEARTYRAFLYLLTGTLLSPVWFALLLVAWIVLPLFAITPLIVPALVSFDALTRYAAMAESALARDLLGIDVSAPKARAGRAGYWGSAARVLADGRFWKRQVYLVERCVLGFGFGLAALSGLAWAGGLIAAPTYYWTSEKALEFGSWHVDSLPRALLMVPAGCLSLVVWTHLVRGAAVVQVALARMLLDEGGSARSTRVRSESRRRALSVHAILYAGLNVVFVVIWAVTTRAYFWPIWTILPLGLVLAAHAAVVRLLEDPGVTTPRARGLAIHTGLDTLLFVFFISVWAVTTRGYFWPMWPALGFAVAVLIHAVIALGFSRERAVLTERIDELTASRAGAVDVSESGLERIERDLHDGAQARLVALGMSLGMAEQKLAADPEAARELVAEARAGVGEALKELRDLARGIRPPILADRGLEAAVAGLAAGSPLHVDVLASIEARPAAAVETAAYFVVAEALANASKHARAKNVGVRIVRDREQLSVSVTDDGVGGADPGGSGLTGLRQRVGALDGVLTVDSPAGGPTTVRAVLPCGS
jgi:signal transduction histidine kinase